MPAANSALSPSKNRVVSIYTHAAVRPCIYSY
jgi:hypothetical protein